MASLRYWTVSNCDKHARDRLLILLFVGLASRVPANLSVQGTINYGSMTLPAKGGQPTLVAYVPQEDTGLVGALTVRSNVSDRLAVSICLRSCPHLSCLS